MPKVSHEYVLEKKKSILKAAIEVCEVKPLYDITMRDIIKASGVSQGGIYRYYSDLDEILVDVINQVNVNADYNHIIDEIISTSNSPIQKIIKLFTFLGEYMKENFSTVGKIQFELTILCANNIDRQNKILSNIVENAIYSVRSLSKIQHSHFKLKAKATMIVLRLSR